MPKISEHTQPIAASIYQHWESHSSNEHRDHLGASVIGERCDRRVWFAFRWFKRPNFPGRILRLFDTGKREELRLTTDLRNIGIELYDADPDTGEQINVKYGRWIGGSLDGMARKVPLGGDRWHVVEMKTHNDKQFQILKKKGVQESHRKHYIQMQIYMHLTGVDRALYVAKNKNDEEIYTERIHHDPALAAYELQRADRISLSRGRPTPIANNPADYRCKLCPFHGLCYTGDTPDKNCRTCKHWNPEDGSCGIGKVADRRIGCDSWEAV